MVAMARKMYLPALTQFSGDLATSVAAKAELGITSPAEKETIQVITDGITAIAGATKTLYDKNAAAQAIEDPGEQDHFYHEEVLPAMEELRSHVDAMEEICSEDYWPVPSYNSMLFWV